MESVQKASPYADVSKKPLKWINLLYTEEV